MVELLVSMTIVTLAGEIDDLLEKALYAEHSDTLTFEDAIVLARKIVKDTAHERMEKDLQNISKVRAEKGDKHDTE